MLPAHIRMRLQLLILKARWRRRARERRRRRYWVHPLSSKRRARGTYYVLYLELRRDPEQFFNYMRMSIESFDHLLQRMSASLQREDTRYRRAINPEERLIVTLRWRYKLLVIYLKKKKIFLHCIFLITLAFTLLFSQVSCYRRKPFISSVPVSPRNFHNICYCPWYLSCPVGRPAWGLHTTSNNGTVASDRGPVSWNLPISKLCRRCGWKTYSDRETFGKRIRIF